MKLRWHRTYTWAYGHSERIGGPPPPMRLVHTDVLEQCVASAGASEVWEPIPIVKDEIPENPQEAAQRIANEEHARRVAEFLEMNKPKS